MQIQSDIHCKHTVNSDEQMNIVSITIIELVLENYRWNPKEVKELKHIDRVSSVNAIIIFNFYLLKKWGIV